MEASLAEYNLFLCTALSLMDPQTPLPSTACPNQLLSFHCNNIPKQISVIRAINQNVCKFVLIKFNIINKYLRFFDMVSRWFRTDLIEMIAFQHETSVSSCLCW